MLSFAHRVGLAFLLPALLSGCGRLGYDVSATRDDAGQREDASIVDGSAGDEGRGSSLDGAPSDLRPWNGDAGPTDAEPPPPDAPSPPDGVGTGDGAPAAGDVALRPDLLLVPPDAPAPDEALSRPDALDPDRGSPTLDAPSPDQPPLTPDGAVPDQAAQPPDVPPPDLATATPDADPNACVPLRWWKTDFSQDPTTMDLNGDGLPDWRMRSGLPFPTDQLVGGVWRSGSELALDTYPLEDFNQRTIFEGRLQHTGKSDDQIGAALWVNVNQQGPEFAALLAEARLQPNGRQTVRLLNKDSSNNFVTLTELKDLPNQLIAVHLDIDVPGRRISATIDGRLMGTFPFVTTGAPVPDRYATAWAGTGSGNFDDLSVTICGP